MIPSRRVEREVVTAAIAGWHGADAAATGGECAPVLHRQALQRPPLTDGPVRDDPVGRRVPAVPRGVTPHSMSLPRNSRPTAALTASCSPDTEGACPPLRAEPLRERTPPPLGGAT